MARTEGDGISIWGVLTFGLTREQMKGVFMFSWRFVIIFHIAWVCGWLTSFGLGPPFASAGDLVELKKAAELTNRLALIRELRLQQEALCQLPASVARSAVQSTIDRLRADYTSLTGQQYPEGKCSP